MKLPGPDHLITVAPTNGRVTVTLGGVVVGESVRALTLTEASYSPVYYIPRADVDMGRLRRTTYQTYCPYKGECTHYSIPAGGERSVNAAWSYESPYAAVGQIKEYVAFYPNRVDAINLTS
jgi:uncharacterized protein (DUF427 family)